MKAWQGDPDLRWDALGKASEDKSLLVNGKEDVEAACTQEVEHELEIILRIRTNAGAAVYGADERGKPTDAVRIRIAKLNWIAIETQSCDCFARGGARAFSE